MMVDSVGGRRIRQAQVFGGLALCWLASTSAGAQDTLQRELDACNAIPDSRERLSCFEALAGEPRPDPPVAASPEATEDSPPAPERRSVTPPGPPVTAGSGNPDFGLEHKQEKASDNGPELQELRVSAARHNDFTGWTLEFENGQVWRQVGTDRYTIRIGETYTIQRAAFNSFLLGNTRNNRKMRVTRIE